jgi:hypothetical protein
MANDAVIMFLVSRMRLAYRLVGETPGPETVTARRGRR